jgi:hypothetical protein
VRILITVARDKWTNCAPTCICCTITSSDRLPAITVAVGPIAEKYFKRRFKALLILLFAAMVLLFAGLTLSLPVHSTSQPHFARTLDSPHMLSVYLSLSWV